MYFDEVAAALLRRGPFFWQYDLIGEICQRAFEQMLMCRRRPSSASAQTSKTFTQSDVTAGSDSHSELKSKQNQDQVLIVQNQLRICFSQSQCYFLACRPDPYRKKSLRPSSCRETIWACSHSALENWPSVSRWQRFKMSSYLSSSSTPYECVCTVIFLNLWGPLGVINHSSGDILGSVSSLKIKGSVHTNGRNLVWSGFAGRLIPVPGSLCVYWCVLI